MSFTYKHGDRPLEGYTILRGIGRGGFGEVYFALSDGGREVALKVIQQNHDIELRGVRHCMNLKSPHLVSVFDVKRNAKGQPFVIMELVAGLSLRDILRANPEGVGTDRAAFLVREIGKGLDYIHERGVVHRDLKPENIFYEDGLVKIGDYGLSKFISVSRQSGQTISVGTVHYMAPEIGSGNYHRGIDIYALGIIFYELLTGDVPYNGDSMGEIIMKHLTDAPDLDRVAEPFREAIGKALAKKPEDRYARVSEFLDAIFADSDLAARMDRLDMTSFAGSTPGSSLQLDEIETLAGAVAAAPPPPDVMPPLGAPIPPPPSLVITPPESESAPPRTPHQRAARDRYIAQNRSGAPEARRGAAADSNPTVLPTHLRFTGEALEHRLAQGAISAAGLALALSFFVESSLSITNIAGHFLSLLAGGAAILLVEHGIVPRYKLDLGIARRLTMLGIAGPVLAVAHHFMHHEAGALPAIFVCLLVIDWSERSSPTRTEPASLGSAFTAGLTGFVLAYVLHTGAALYVGALMASLSLIVNATSPFLSKERRQRMKAAGQPRPQTRSDNSGSRDDALGSFTASSPQKPDEAIARLHDIGASPANASAESFGLDTDERDGRRARAAEPISEDLDEVDGPKRRDSDQLVRPQEGRVIAGVCAGIAERSGWDPIWLRVAFIAGALMTFGTAIIVYFVCSLSIPNASEARSSRRSRRVDRERTRRSSQRAATSKLTRSHGDRIIAGVCGGLAERYGCEPVWIRFAAIALAVVTFGYGILAYVILWALMPSDAEAAAPRKQREPSGTSVDAADVERRPATWLWLVFSLLAISAGVLLFIRLSVSYSHATSNARALDEGIWAIIVSAGCFSLAIFGIFRSRLRTPLPFSGRTVTPLLLSASLTAFCSAIATLGLFDLSDDETIGASAVVLVSGLLAAVLASRLIGAVRATRPEQRSFHAMSSGWSMLGALLVVAALTTVLAGTALATTSGQDLARLNSIPVSAEVTRLAENGAHLIPGAIIYLAGMFCLLLGRRGGGASHVLRGAFALTVLGAMTGVVAVAIPQNAIAYARADELGGALSQQISWNLAAMLFVLGVVTLVCLAWPARPVGIVPETSDDQARSYS